MGFFSDIQRKRISFEIEALLTRHPA